MRSTTLVTWPTYQSDERCRSRALNRSRPRSIERARHAGAAPAEPALLDARRACGVSTVAASAGLSISATNTDSTIAETIVTENWR